MGMSIEELQRVFLSVYEGKPIDDVLSFGFHPEAGSARGANTCRLAVHRPLDGTTVAVFLVIGHLVKGAAGLAVQNLNVIFGFAESEGLWQLPVLP